MSKPKKLKQVFYGWISARNQKPVRVADDKEWLVLHHVAVHKGWVNWLSTDIPLRTVKITVEEV